MVISQKQYGYFSKTIWFISQKDYLIICNIMCVFNFKDLVGAQSSVRHVLIFTRHKRNKSCFFRFPLILPDTLYIIPRIKFNFGGIIVEYDTNVS